MEITSNFIKQIIGSIISDILKKKLGVNKANLDISGLTIKDVNDEMQMKAEVTVSMSKSDIWKLIRGK